jgi:hypothetical protein
MKRYKGEIEYKTKQRKATTTMPNKDVTQSNRAPLRHEERGHDPSRHVELMQPMDPHEERSGSSLSPHETRLPLACLADGEDD